MPKNDSDESKVQAAYRATKQANSNPWPARPNLPSSRPPRATVLKDRRVNIRLSSGDLSDIQTRALEEGVPYQTLIASVLHKYVTGRLAEKEVAPKTLRSSVGRRPASSE